MILGAYIKCISDMTYYIDIDSCYGKLGKCISGHLVLQDKILKFLFYSSFVNTPFDVFFNM